MVVNQIKAILNDGKSECLSTNFAGWEVQTTCDLWKCDVYGEAYFSKKKKKNLYKWFKRFQEYRNCNEDEYKLGMSTMVSTPEMVDSVNRSFWLTDEL